MTQPPSRSVQDRLPPINYDTHPAYAYAKETPIRLSERILAIGKLLGPLAYLADHHIRYVLSHKKPANKGKAAYLDILNRDGVVAIRLQAEQRTRMLDASQAYFNRLQSSRDGIALGKRSYNDGQLITKRADAPGLFRTTEDMLEMSGILPSARAYFKRQIDIVSITMQINDEWDTYWRSEFEEMNLPAPPTAFMHVDNTYGVIKAIFYASDVTNMTGPFSYVPGSHRAKVTFFESLIMRAVDIWRSNGRPENRRLFLALPRWLRKTAKFGDDILPGTEFSEFLLAQERVMTSEDGDIFLFDIKGIHRGGMVRKGERRAIQIMMR